MLAHAIFTFFTLSIWVSLHSDHAPSRKQGCNKSCKWTYIVQRAREDWGLTPHHTPLLSLGGLQGLLGTTFESNLPCTTNFCFIEFSFILESALSGETSPFSLTWRGLYCEAGGSSCLIPQSGELTSGFWCWPPILHGSLCFWEKAVRVRGYLKMRTLEPCLDFLVIGGEKYKYLSSVQFIV